MNAATRRGSMSSHRESRGITCLSWQVGFVVLTSSSASLSQSVFLLTQRLLHKITRIFQLKDQLIIISQRQSWQKVNEIKQKVWGKYLKIRQRKKLLCHNLQWCFRFCLLFLLIYVYYFHFCSALFHISIIQIKFTNFYYMLCCVC